MTDNDKIEELWRDAISQLEKMSNIQLSTVNCDIRVLQALYNAGYHKTIWHKVSDEDLPISGEVVRVVLEWLGVKYYVQGIHTEGYGWTFADNPNKDAKVIAWTELPEYKE